MAESSLDSIEQHRESVYRFALSLTRSIQDAEDIAQESLLAAYRQQRDGHSIRSMKSWLLRVARNTWIDRCRQSTPTSLPTDSDAIIAAADRDPLRLATDREAVDQALSAMLRLPQRQREVLHLHTMEQLTTEEIARLLNVTRDNVKTNLSLARKAMRRMCQLASTQNTSF